MAAHVFHHPAMSVPGVDSVSPSAGKPALFMRAIGDKLKRQGPQRFKPVTRQDLCLVHDPAYVDGVFNGTINNGFENRDMRVPEACLYTVGCMYAAARDVGLSGRIACAPTSGFHHAGYAWGGGFCTFNGLMVTAVKFMQYYPGTTVGILDCDFHYGDGTADILKRRPDLAGRICHQTSGQYFHGGEDPLQFFAWLHGAIAMINAFGCDIVLYQAGADMHIDDPLGGLLDDDEMAKRDRIVFTRIRGGIVWNLAGGYRTDSEGSMAPVLQTHYRTVVEVEAAELVRP